MYEDVIRLRELNWGYWFEGKEFLNDVVDSLKMYISWNIATQSKFQKTFSLIAKVNVILEVKAFIENQILAIYRYGLQDDHKHCFFFLRLW